MIQYCFLLGHIQDFSLFQPFWERIPTEKIMVYIRYNQPMGIPTGLVRYMEVYLTEHNIPFTRYFSSKDIQAYNGTRVLISASESSTSVTHMMNSEVVIEFKERNAPTFLLQHGIWTEYFNDFRFESDYILSWSDEHEEFLRTNNRYIVTGCPKFDPYHTHAGSKDSDIVLCTTNLHWKNHSMSRDDFYSGIYSVAKEFSNKKFIIKLHPMETKISVPLTNLDNVALFDESDMYASNIKTSTLVMGASFIITTLSTIALEAALAKKPFVIVDTGNMSKYKHTTLTNIKDVSKMLYSLPFSYEQFTDYYYDKRYFGQSLDECLKIIQSICLTRHG